MGNGGQPRVAETRCPREDGVGVPGYDAAPLQRAFQADVRANSASIDGAALTGRLVPSTTRDREMLDALGANPACQAMGWDGRANSLMYGVS